MTTDRIAALEALLGEAEAAHGVFETTELNGVYDREWPRWYARYAVEHGIGALLGHPITVDELARFLSESWDEGQRTDPPPTDAWATRTARQMVAEL